jgi:hypothetical protein
LSINSPSIRYDDDDDEENGPLVDRLRNLQWPEVDPDLRERSWEQFQRMIDQGAAKADPDGDGEPEEE